MTLAKDVVREAKKYVVDSTAVLSASTPIFAGLEMLVMQIPAENSVNARLLSAKLTYMGMGYAVGKAREFYLKMMQVSDQTSKSAKFLYDAAYVALFNMAVTPPFYYYSGVHDIKKIVFGTAIAIGVGLVSGGPVGYVIDAYRDLTGIQESRRLPAFVKNMNPRLKLGLATALTAAALGITVKIYDLAPGKNADAQQKKEKIASFISAQTYMPAH